MSIFSGSKKTKSTTNVKTTSSTGYGQASDQGSIVAGLTAADGSTVSVATSDHGAIEAARDVQFRALDLVGESLNAALLGAQEQAGRAFGLASDAQAGDAGEFRKLVMIAGGVVALVLVVSMFKR